MKNRFFATPLNAVAVALLVSCLADTVQSAPPKAQRIDSLMHALSARGQFNGALLVAEHGRPIYRNGFGYADFKKQIPFTPSTPCYLASLTKQFTAMAIMILHERHRISYEDSLPKFFPDFPPYGRPVTIRHLLNHTSGIPDYVRLGAEHPGLTNAGVLKALLGQDSLDFPPGAKFGYSNSNYVLLAMIIEKVSGRPYPDYLKQQVFDPLDMRNSFVHTAGHADPPGIARGYNRFGDPSDYDLLTCGEGGIYTTVEDLFKWDQALSTEKLVTRSTMAEAFSRPRLNDGTTSGYGFGWVLGAYRGETVASHAGRYGGFNTYIKRFLGDRNLVVFLTNHDFKNMSAVGNPLVAILYDSTYTLPRLSVAEAMDKVYQENGISAALALYRSLKARGDTTHDFSESELNELGYELLGRKKTADALQVLKLNAESFPSSANVYDSLGEAYLKSGDTTHAAENYRRSLALDPTNTNAASALRKLGGN